MPGKKGALPNNPKKGSKVVTRTTKSGPNKGTKRTFREYYDRDGAKHSTPQGKKHR